MIRESKREVKNTVTDTMVICELCGNEAREGEWNVPNDIHAEEQVTLEFKHTVSYPEFGSSEGVVYDCCPGCFKLKVQPALESLGLKPRKTESSW